MIGFIGASIGITGGLIGIVGITIPGESSTEALIGSLLVGRARMEASFAMTTLEKKRTASAIVSWTLIIAFMMIVTLKQ